jgi:hypothetical protein
LLFAAASASDGTAQQQKLAVRQLYWLEIALIWPANPVR